VSDFELTSGEKSHPLWAKLKAHLQERLADARVRNDQPASEQDTAALRGRIAALKLVIALGDDRPVIGE
jgi:hypothetical protein